MAETHEHGESTRSIADGQTWVAGAISGLAGGIVLGLMLQLMMTPIIAMAIPALYGASGIVAGWIAHLFHSLVFGLVFAGIVTSSSTLSGYANRVSSSLGLGIVYGVVLWIVAAAIVMPIWLGVVGFPAAPPLPNFNPMTLVGHVVYGAVLGVLFPLVRNR